MLQDQVFYCAHSGVHRRRGPASSAADCLLLGAQASCCWLRPVLLFHVAAFGMESSTSCCRARKAKLQAVTSTTTLPLLDTEQEEKPAFASVPIKRNSVGHLVDTNLPNLAKKSLDWLTGKPLTLLLILCSIFSRAEHTVAELFVCQKQENRARTTV